MKNIKKYGFVSVILLSALYIISCTEGFEEINTSPYEATDKQLEQEFLNVGGNFLTIQRAIMCWLHWKYQLQENLNGDCYAQYLIPPTPFAGNVNNVNYGFVTGWNLWMWKIGYEDVMTPSLLVNRFTQGEKGFEHFKAWASILKVYAMSRVTDMYGPIVYSKFGTSDTDIPYDSQKEVYDQFFKQLENAVTVLTPFADKGNSQFKKFDLAFEGDIKKWIKAANSIRMRLAMRIVLVAPEKAKTEFEAAINHKHGVISSNDDNFIIALPEYQPLKTISVDWKDTRMSATMESYLKGYKDPRLNIFFQGTADDPNKMSGIRQGVKITSKTEYDDKTSAIGKWFVTNNKAILFTFSEICFLKAEAALRGWSVSETAQSLYEKGIEASFQQWSAGTASEYISDETRVAEAYTDPIGHKENNVASGSKFLSKATIKWDDKLSKEKLLEKIITQKWIALFPNGQEAWSEFRRTGYPKLFPLVINNSGGEIPDNQFVKRIKFSSDEYNDNAAQVKKAIQLLKGGKDSYNTLLWWDVYEDTPNNF